MDNFHTIESVDNRLCFPDGIAEEVKYFAGRIRGQCALPDRELSWDEVGMIARFANREIQLAACAESQRYAEIRKTRIDLNPIESEFWEVCSTPAGLLRLEGPGIVLQSWLEESQADWASIKQVFPEKDDSCIYCVLCAYALLRVDNALSAQIAGDTQAAMKNLVAAADVLSDANQALGYSAGSEWTKKREREPRRKGALALHADTYALRDEVVAYWKDNIDSSLSADDAASILEPIFPLVHRTLARYVSAEKRLLRASRVQPVLARSTLD